MRTLQTLLQALAGLLILFVPMMIVWWVLTTLDIEPLSFISNLLGIICEPLNSFVGIFVGEKSFTFKDIEVDLTPIFTCAALFVFAIILTVLAKVVNTFRSSVHFVKAKTDVHLAQKRKEAEELEQENKLFENSIGYCVVRYKTDTTSSAYLVSSGLSAEDIKKMFMEHFNRYMYLDAQIYKSSTEDNKELIFEDVPNTLTYALQLQEKVIDLNKQLDKAGTKILVNIGIYCTSPTVAKDQGFYIANKVCNLSAPGEVSCSKEVKEIFEKDRADHNLKFISKGMYDLGHEVEIFFVTKLF